MSDHELSPAQEAANGLPTDVLERAAEAGRDTWTDEREYDIEEVVRAALPILRPAIEAALKAGGAR
ncbi:MAG: hypothetical protein WBA46_14825 [Thermomicrobiales bacterium]